MLPTYPFDAIEAILNKNKIMIITSRITKLIRVKFGFSTATLGTPFRLEKTGIEKRIPSPIAIHTEVSMIGNGAVRLYGSIAVGDPNPNKRPKNLMEYDVVSGLKNTHPSMTMDSV